MDRDLRKMLDYAARQVFIPTVIKPLEEVAKPPPTFTSAVTEMDVLELEDPTPPEGIVVHDEPAPLHLRSSSSKTGSPAKVADGLGVVINVVGKLGDRMDQHVHQLRLSVVILAMGTTEIVAALWFAVALVLLTR